MSTEDLLRQRSTSALSKDFGSVSRSGKTPPPFEAFSSISQKSQDRMMRCRPSGVPLDDIKDARVPLMSAKTCPKASPVCPVCMQIGHCISQHNTRAARGTPPGCTAPNGWYCMCKYPYIQGCRLAMRSTYLPSTIGPAWAGRQSHSAAGRGKHTPKCLAPSQTASKDGASARFHGFHRSVDEHT